MLGVVLVRRNFRSDLRWYTCTEKTNELEISRFSALHSGLQMRILRCPNQIVAESPAGRRSCCSLTSEEFLSSCMTTSMKSFDTTKQRNCHSWTEIFVKRLCVTCRKVHALLSFHAAGKRNGENLEETKHNWLPQYRSTCI